MASKKNSGDLFFLEHCFQKKISAVYRSANRYWSVRIKELQEKINSLECENTSLKNQIIGFSETQPTLTQPTIFQKPTQVPVEIPSPRFY
jgi:hypothetical protein